MYIIRVEQAAETTNERGRFDDESRWYSVIITVARDSARKTVVRREGRPCVDASENASLFLSLLPRSVCSSGSPRHRSGSPAPRLFPWNAGQLSGWPASASRTVGCDCHPQGRSEAKEPRSGLTAAGDRARGRRLRAQRGPKPVLPRFGKFQSFRWSGACGQVLSCVRPHYMRQILRRGPVWRYAGRVQIV